MTAPPLLEVDALVAGYEPGLPIVRGASLGVRPGEIVVLLGPNGAGKSTLVKALAGLVPVAAGSARLAGAEVTHLAAHRRSAVGIGFVPQTENVFAGMSVADNLSLAAAILPRAQRPARTAAVIEMFPDLGRQRGSAAGRLSGGQRQMLAIARALMAGPRLLMLDEPSAGLSPKLVDQVLAHLTGIRDAGVAVLLVEQNARAALAVADRACVLVEGRVAHQGAGAELLDDPLVADLYLGRRRAA